MKPAENIWLQQGPTDLSKIERLWCFYKLLTFAVFRIWTDITHNYGHTKDLLVKTNSWWDTDVCEDHTHVKKKKNPSNWIFVLQGIFRVFGVSN